MTETSFLIELLLEHKLQKSTKDLIKQRIKELEQERPLAMRPAPMPHVATTLPNPTGVPQSASTLAALARQEAEQGKPAPIELAPTPPPEPVAVIAQTPAAMAAMASRQQAISESIAGRVNKDTGRPRKF